MKTLTIRISADLAERLRNRARARGISVNKLAIEIIAQALDIYDAERRFRTMAADADMPTALAMLNRLDAE